MDDDEDVIYQGEPLDQYLQNIGCVDFLSVNRQSHFEQDHQVKRTVFSRLKGVFLQFFGIHSFCNPLWHSENFLDTEACQEIINIILESKLLFSEDFQLISNLKFEKNTRRLSWCQSSFFLSLILLIRLSNLKIRNALLLSITLYFGGWTFGKYYLRRKYVNKVQELVNALQKFSFLVKKSLKYLQESEIISHGFTYAVTGSTAEQLENSSLQFIERKWHISPGFRRSIALALDNMIKLVSKSTRDLLLFSPLCSQFDNSQHYLSCHEELLSKLSLISGDCDEVCENQTEIKLNFLKTLHNHHLLLVSEFMRRFSMSFCPLLQKNSKHFHLMSTMFLTDIIVCCLKMHKSLDMEFTYLCNYGISTGLMEYKNRKNYPVTKYGDIYVKVHSAIFHLQSVLRSTHCVEECLKNYENIDTEETKLQELNITLKNILKELEMCKSCFEEGQKNIESLRYSDDNFHEKETKELNEASFIPCENIRIIHVGKTDLDPIVPDEVFEALCTQETLLTDDSDDFLQLNKVEQERREIQKSCAKIMLEELKYVLVDKAKEWKEREEKALELKRLKEKVNETESISKYVKYKNSEIENIKVNNETHLNGIVKDCATLGKIIGSSDTSDIAKEALSRNELENDVKIASTSTGNNRKQSTNYEAVVRSVSNEHVLRTTDPDSSDDNFPLNHNCNETTNFKFCSTENSNDNPNHANYGQCSENCEENINEVNSDITTGLGLPAFAIPQHRFMLKDSDSETFYGYGENSDSEDSDVNVQ